MHDFDVVVRKALFVSEGTPNAIIQLLDTESTRIGSQPVVKELFVAQGSGVVADAARGVPEARRCGLRT